MPSTAQLAREEKSLYSSLSHSARFDMPGTETFTWELLSWRCCFITMANVVLMQMGSLNLNFDRPKFYDNDLSSCYLLMLIMKEL